jgi:GR25 family glycosyltransferase involved in LPS biosynthesis/tetratricopeptide (TPR) repeat protein
MIVKNEAHIIEDTLEKLTNKIKIDYYVICDTGSDDQTPELIKSFFEKKGIDGFIKFHEWKDFGHNRTLALQEAYCKSDYLLVFDADDHIEGNFILPDKLTEDGYMLKFGNSTSSYDRMCLIKNNIRWRYIGVLHEYITADFDVSKGSITGDYYIVSGRTSSRNKDPGKYLKDAKILENGYYTALKNNDSIFNRYVYYCANSYSDAGDQENAIKWYKMTLKSMGWFDERYNSCLRLFELTGDQTYLVESFHHNPRRVEGMYTLIRHYCCENQYTIAMGYYNFIKGYYEHDYPTDDISTKLFARTLDYNFYLPYYMIIVCEKTRDYSTGIKMYLVIFEKMNDCLLAGEWWVKNLLFNMQFFMDHITDNSFFEKLKVFLQFLITAGISFDFPFLEKYLPVTETILFYTGFSDFLWNITYSQSNALGGSERAVLCLAKELSKKYKILIVGDVLEETITVGGNSISFVHRFKMEKQKLHFKYIIVSRYVSFFTIFPNFTSDTLFLMAHDTHFMNNLSGCDLTSEEIISSNLNKITGCICLTNWHSELYKGLYPNLKIDVINNGISIELFPQRYKKIKSSFIYTSGSIRGLKRLLELWPEITKVLPDATLNISSYEEFPKNDFDRELNDIINSFDNVFHLGKLNQKKLYNIMDKSEFWLYPCSFKETSCITAMEMMMSEVICMYYPIAGLTDTMNGHGVQVSQGNEVETLKNLTNKEEIIKLSKEYAVNCSWENRAREWEKVLNSNNFIRVINLKKRKDRKLEMESALTGVEYKFVEGIDGISLGSSKEIQELFKDNDHRYHKGVIGCALSHIKVWKELIDDPLNDFYVILEDDLMINNFKQKLNRAIELFKGIDYLVIGSFDIHTENENTTNLKVVKKENLTWTGGTHGYIISKSAAKGLLKNIERYSLKRSIDFEIVVKRSFDIYFLNEYIVKQKSFEDTDIQRHSECFHFANKLPKKIVFYYNHEFNIDLLSDYFNSLKSEYSVVVTNDLEGIKHVDEIIFVHTVFDRINWDCEISYLNTEPLNLECRLWNVVHIHNSYPELKSIYDYSLSNIQIMNKNGILNTHFLEYRYEPMEVNFLKELSAKTPKEYDFGIMCSGSVPTTDPDELTPPRRREIVKSLLSKGFTINIISGWGKYRDHELAKCKTILNIHGQYAETPSAIFEHIRCNRLLYAGYPVISETSILLDPQFVETHRTLKCIPFESFFNFTKRSKVIDCFLFYNELELLEYRLNVLKGIVDYSVIVEATTTFTGKPKKLYFDPERFKDFNIIHIVVDDMPHVSDFVLGDQWKNEAHQRNCIERGLKKLPIKHDDFVLISDLDEIPDPCTLNLIKMESNLEVLSQFEQDFYYYNLNNKLPDLWYSCKIFKYRFLKGKTIQELRLEVLYGIYPGGWHLSYFGSPGYIANKIKNFGHQEFNTSTFTDESKILSRIENSIDVFDRPIHLDYVPVTKNNYLPPNFEKLPFYNEKRYCFIHSCNTDGDTYRLEHLLNTLSKFQIFEKIFINNIGLPLEKIDNRIIEVCQFSTDTSLYEVPTINKIRDFSREHKNCEILYLHTKGTGHSKDSQNINDWIDMMLYFLIERWPVAVNALKDHDVAGCNYHTYDSCRAPPHFSGNFWWAKTDYLSGLPDCGTNKFDAEFWLLQNNPKLKCLHDTGGMNHYFNVYPPENYR